jgi:hypothetical protein
MKTATPMATQVLDTDTRPPLNARERLAHFQAKYGFVRGIWTFITGEKPPKLTEKETPIPAYAQMMVYTASVANIFLFGVAELFAIVKFGFSPFSIILAIPLVLIFQLVYAMDRGTIRTLPRIALLATRRQWGMFTEHIAYVTLVLALEAATVMYLAYLIENDIQRLIQGQQLIPGGFTGVVALLVVRGLLYAWTIPHAELIKEPLPVTWSTIENNLIGLLGGGLMIDVEGIDPEQLSPEVKLATLNLLLTRPKRAAWSWNRRQRREAQETLDLAHRTAVVAEFNTLTNGSAGLKPGQKALVREDFDALLAPMLARLDEIAANPGPDLATVHEVANQKAEAMMAIMHAEMAQWQQTLREQFAEQLAEIQTGGAGKSERVTTSTSTAARTASARVAPIDIATRRNSGPRAKPMAGSEEYPAYIDEQRRILASQNKPTTAQSIAEASGENIDDVRAALRAWKAQQAAAQAAKK